MKVFISWSGVRSRSVAESLREWLPLVIQSVNPWMATADIEKGSRWFSELTFNLERTSFAIICLTPENLNSPWMLYEAGVLAKVADNRVICPYLFGFEPSDLTGPLVQFQALRANKEDTQQLVSMLNRALGDEGLPNDAVNRAFDVWWPALKTRLGAISDSVPEAKPKSAERLTRDLERVPSAKEVAQTDRDLLEEILKKLSASDTDGRSVEEGEKYVFIVHGHDEGTKEAVARFIEKMGAKVIILHEQPNEGKTIIEKFETYSGKVGYAVILMTPDDRGGLADLTFKEQSMRARQNVILELGYFMAKLGRGRVCALHREGVEVPSDYGSVLYIPLDKQGAWRIQLAKELKTAGLNVDFNKVIDIL